MYQTYLLDKDNRVIAIGNPVHNLNVKELYLKMFLGNESTDIIKDKKCTVIKVDKNCIDLGTFDWKHEQIANFILTNTGKELMVIEDVSTSCGCVKVDYIKEPIQPGKSLKLTVKYQAEHSEHFNKTITVYCNGKDSPIQLKISGNAE